ncbi:MAG: AEC family transporter [Promethearchaeota archaeon]
MDWTLFLNLSLVYGYIAIGIILGIVIGGYREKIQKTGVNILINFITPIQIFITILVSDFGLNVFSVIQILGVAILAHFIQFYIGLRYFKSKKNSNSQIGAQVLHGSFPNSLYFMVPLILFIFPNELLIIPVIYASANLTLKATVLQFQVHHLGAKIDDSSFWVIVRKILLFPPFLGIVFGLLVRLIPPIQSSIFLKSMKSPISFVTSAMSALLIGISLISVSKKMFKSYWKLMGQISVIRFGLGFLVFIAFGFLLRFPTDQTAIRTILLLTVCAPPAQNNVIYTMYFEFDEQLSAVSIVMLTIVGLLLMPLFLWFGMTVL